MGKYSQITNAIKKNTSYLKPKKLESFGCPKGKKIKAKEIRAKAVIVHRR